MHFMTQRANDRGVLTSDSMPATRLFKGARGHSGRVASRFQLRPRFSEGNLQPPLIPSVGQDKFENKRFASRFINLSYRTLGEEIDPELCAKCNR